MTAPGSVFLNHERCDEKIVETVRKMVAEGYEAKRAWTTSLFFTEGSPVRTLFSHNRYGISTSAKVKELVPLLYEHVVHTPTLWFSGPKETRPKERLLAHTKSTFESWHDLDRPAEELVRDALCKLLYPFAHDSKCASGSGKGGEVKKNPEGGPKMFFNASPWQMLNAIHRSGDSIKSIGNVSWPSHQGYNKAWMENGQPVLPYPTCSVYAMRSDETLSDVEKHEYFFTLDVDGINALSKEQEKGSKQTRDELCEQVINIFQKNNGDDAPPILSRLTRILTQCFGKMTDMPIAVSWHKTIGYKPSWRAYVVGVAFRDNYDAKAFVHDELKNACLQMFEDTLPEPFVRSGRLDKIIDCGTYSDGWDRCLGSAKLNSQNPTQMRFLQPNPLVNISDPSLVSLFNECPNRYLLTVLGWMYPIDVWEGTRERNSFVLARQPTAGTRSSKLKQGIRRVTTGTEKSSKRAKYDDALSPLNERENKKLSELIAGSLKAHGLVHPTDASIMWKGENGLVKTLADGAVDYFEMQAAAGDFMLCGYRNCGFKKGEPAKPVVARIFPGTKLHSPESSAGKMNFRVSLVDDQHTWIKQNCFKCGGEFGHKMQNLCTVVLPPGVSLREHVMGCDAGSEDNTDETHSPASVDSCLPALPTDDPTEEYFVPNVMIIVGGMQKKLF